MSLLWPIQKIFCLGLALLLLPCNTGLAQTQETEPAVVLPTPAVGDTVAHAAYTADGLLEEALLNKVYQRDPQLQRLLRRGSLTTKVLPFLNAATIGSTALSQNIMTLNLIDVQQPRISRRKRVPITGIVGQSILLSSLMTISYLRLHFDRRIKVRQKFLQGQVQNLLRRLETGENPIQIRQELNGLAGETSSREFIAFWQFLYRQPVTP